MLTRAEFNRIWSPLLVVFQLFGLTQFTLDTTNRKVKCLLRTYLVCIVLHLIGIVTNNVFTALQPTHAHVYSFVGHLMWSSLIQAYGVTFFESWRRSSGQKKFLASIHRMSLHGVEIALAKFCRRWIWKSWGALGVTMAVMIVGVAMFGGLAWQIFVVSWFPLFMVHMRTIQVAVFVDVLTEVLGAIVKVLTEDCQEGGVTDSRIEMCIHLYGEVWVAFGLISTTFGWSLISIIFMKLCEMLHTSYWILYNGYHFQSALLAIYNACMSVPNAVTLLTLFETCKRYQDMVQQVTVALHLVPNRRRNSRRSQMIRTFSCQIMHERIEVTANGFLVIDYRLFGKMLSMMAGYTVILIQFQQKES